MNGRKHRIRKGIRKKLPRHTWVHQASKVHQSHAGEANKPFIVAVITIVLLIVLSIFLFYGSKFAGKAYTAPEGNSFDVVSKDGKIKVIATLQPETTTSGVYFEMSLLTPDANLCQDFQSTSITNGLWGSFYDISCTNHKLIFGDATLNNEEFKTGTFTIAEFIPPAELASFQVLQLRVDPVDVYDSNGRDLFPEGDTFTLSSIACTPGLTAACGSTVGTCLQGTQTCQEDGVWGVCVGEVAAVAEVCNGLDDDCDGLTDNGDGVCSEDAHCGSYTNICAADQECNFQTSTCTPLTACTTNTQCQNAARACADGYCRPDSDHDGVADVGDSCPGTATTTLTIQKVDAQGCLTTQTADQGTPVARDSGSGGGCVPRYSCGTWSYCNATLQQSSTCLDQSQCRKPAKAEVRACAVCQESWICSVWSSCANSVEIRSCKDEHSCGTSANKPDESRSCYLAPSPPPAKPSASSSSPSPKYTPPPAQPQQPLPAEPDEFTKIWSQYRFYLIGVLGGVAVLGTLLITAVHLFRKRQPAVNVEELKKWVAQERKIGTSDQQIRGALKGTEWTENEIKAALNLR